MMPVLASIWQKLVIPMHDESEAECVMCKQMTSATIRGQTLAGRGVNIALCRACQLNPVVVDFAKWLATEPWLWLSAGERASSDVASSFACR